MGDKGDTIDINGGNLGEADAETAAAAANTGLFGGDGQYKLSPLASQVLSVLREDSRTTPEKIADMLGCKPDEARAVIRDLEANQILSFKPTVNWERTDIDHVSAIIELKITPQRDMGFEKVARRIYKYPQVKSLYLMSGAYDLALMIEGRTMKEVALFVAEKLAPMESVVSTATHFVLRAYKENGFVFDEREKDHRQVITL